MNYFYKYVRPCDLDDAELMYFTLYAFHKIKTGLDVTFRLDSREYVPMYFFRCANKDEAPDFSRGMEIDGFFDAVREFVAIRWQPDPLRLIEVIAHEVHHLRDDRDALLKLKMNPDEIKNIRSRIPIDPDVHDEPHDSYVNKPGERRAREFAAKFKKWSIVSKYFAEVEKNKHIDILNVLIMIAYPKIGMIK